MNSGGARYSVACIDPPRPRPRPAPPRPFAPLQIAMPSACPQRRVATCRGRALYGGNGGGVDPESLEKDNDANIHALGDRVGLLRQVQIQCSSRAGFRAWERLRVATS